MMRVWEFTDNNGAPPDLVLEQDFILRVRRMQRHGTPCVVLNCILGAIEALTKDAKLLEETQQKLQNVARTTKGAYFPMSNGDVFMVWDGVKDRLAPTIQAVETVLIGHGVDMRHVLTSYPMPENYAVLRERTNYYVDIARAAAIVGDAGNKIEAAQGRLTAKNVDQIGELLSEIDLRRYGRTQTIYRYTTGAWTPVGEEYFIGFDDLRRERFPKLEVLASEHFFLALCGMLDQRLLSLLTKSYDIIRGRTINLNVAVMSIIGTVFTQFVHQIPREQRALIGFELHCGDLFQDFSVALGAIEVLKREGFRVILDSVTPDMVTHLDLTSFDVDAYKINVSKDRVAQLDDPAIRLGLERLPPNKLIFFRCDNQRALTIGRELGVSQFQGWLIDDLGGKKS